VVISGAFRLAPITTIPMQIDRNGKRATFAAAKEQRQCPTTCQRSGEYLLDYLPLNQQERI
jgi:hypothetical protein